MHVFEEGKQVPQFYVLDKEIHQQRLNPVNAASSVCYLIPIPQNIMALPLAQRILSLKFQYQKAGDNVMVYQKW